MPKVRLFPEVRLKGGRNYQWRFYYHKVMDAPLLFFFLGLAMVFLAVTVMFAVLFYLFHGLSAPSPSPFDYLYFSIVTFTTVGFGDITPIGAGRWVAIIEMFCGVVFIGTLAGLLFAKFSKAPSPLVWSSPVVLNRSPGKTPSIEVRITNIIGNDVVNVEPKLFVQRIVKTPDGIIERPLIPVPLERTHIPIVAFSWILSHPVTEHSPLKKWAEGQAPEGERLVGFVHGTDATVNRDIYIYARWKPSDMKKGRFREVITEYSETDELQTIVEMDLSRLDEVVALEREGSEQSS